MKKGLDRNYSLVLNASQLGPLKAMTKIRWILFHEVPQIIVSGQGGIAVLSLSNESDLRKGEKEKECKVASIDISAKTRMCEKIVFPFIGIIDFIVTNSTQNQDSCIISLDLKGKLSCHNFEKRVPVLLPGAMSFPAIDRLTLTMSSISSDFIRSLQCSTSHTFKIGCRNDLLFDDVIVMACDTIQIWQTGFPNPMLLTEVKLPEEFVHSKITAIAYDNQCNSIIVKAGVLIMFYIFEEKSNIKKEETENIGNTSDLMNQLDLVMGIQFEYESSGEESKSEENASINDRESLKLAYNDVPRAVANDSYEFNNVVEKNNFDYWDYNPWNVNSKNSNASDVITNVSISTSDKNEDKGSHNTSNYEPVEDLRIKNPTLSDLGKMQDPWSEKVDTLLTPVNMNNQAQALLQANEMQVEPLNQKISEFDDINDEDQSSTESSEQDEFDDIMAQIDNTMDAVSKAASDIKKMVEVKTIPHANVSTNSRSSGMVSPNEAALKKTNNDPRVEASIIRQFSEETCNWTPLLRLRHVKDVIAFQYSPKLNMICSTSGYMIYFHDITSGKEIWSENIAYLFHITNSMIPVNYSNTITSIHFSECFMDEKLCDCVFLGTNMGLLLLFSIIDSKFELEFIYTPTNGSQSIFITHWNKIINDKAKDVTFNVVHVTNIEICHLSKTFSGKFNEMKRKTVPTMKIGIVILADVIKVEGVSILIVLTQNAFIMAFDLITLEIIWSQHFSVIDMLRINETIILKDGRLGCWTVHEGWQIYSLLRDTGKYYYQISPIYNLESENNAKIENERNLIEDYDDICKVLN